MEKEKIKGIIVPLLTPVNEEEMICETNLRKIVRHVIDHGVHGILAF